MRPLPNSILEVELLQLYLHPWRMVLASEGGVVLGLWHEERPVLRDMVQTWLQQPNATQSAAFPMVPICNRVFGNAFEWQGQRFGFVSNFVNQPYYLHGDAWLRRWRVTQQSPDFVRMELTVQDSPGPWNYETWQTFQLTDQEMIYELGVKNLGELALPFGIGWHPYFEAPPESKFCFASERLWRMAEDSTPLGLQEPPQGFQFEEAQALPPGLLDLAFLGWNGQARIEQPHGLNIQIEANPAPKQFVLYRPLQEGGDPVHFTCLEPLSHIPNALGDSIAVDQGIGDPMLPLDPGETRIQQTKLRID